MARAWQCHGDMATLRLMWLLWFLLLLPLRLLCMLPLMLSLNHVCFFFCHMPARSRPHNTPSRSESSLVP